MCDLIYHVCDIMERKTIKLILQVIFLINRWCPPAFSPAFSIYISSVKGIFSHLSHICVTCSIKTVTSTPPYPAAESSPIGLRRKCEKIAPAPFQRKGAGTILHEGFPAGGEGHGARNPPPVLSAGGPAESARPTGAKKADNRRILCYTGENQRFSL